MATLLNLKTKLVFAVFFFLIFCSFSYGSFISRSDGVAASKVPPFLRLRAAAEAEAEAEACEQTYGFMPCTTTALGNLVLILVYSYLMFRAATYLHDGSDMLLEILGPGIVGALFLPMLGALPDAMLVLVSGLSGSKETAQRQVSVGMGLLAGSTVMLLTVVWGACLVAGKCDIENFLAVDSKDTKYLSLTGSGISTDILTNYAGIIMAISVIPFVIVQWPQISHSNSGRQMAVLLALVVSVLLLISYGLYQVFRPWIQSRHLAYAKHKHIIAGILKHFKMHALGKLSTDDGEPNEEVLRRIFTAIDENKDGHLSHSEVRALVVGICFNEISLDENEVVEKVMTDFDTSLDSRISVDEFIAGVGRWLQEARGNNISSHAGMKYIDDYHTQTKREHDLLAEQADETVEKIENPRWNSFKAVVMLLLGTGLAAAFSDPLVDAVDNFSTATSIPTFFISFIVLPLATNSGEAVFAIISASEKKLRSASLTFSELYGSITVGNLLCLSVFLALVYLRGLAWDFSCEVLAILFVCIVMGIFACTRTTFPLWTSAVAFLLYPTSLALVYVLAYIFGLP